jgi:serine-type D-Ala-D-Ala endopeptidase (penicillin-binding protein 7)
MRSLARYMVLACVAALPGYAKAAAYSEGAGQAPAVHQAERFAVTPAGMPVDEQCPQRTKQDWSSVRVRTEAVTDQRPPMLLDEYLRPLSASQYTGLDWISITQTPYVSSGPTTQADKCPGIISPDSLTKDTRHSPRLPLSASAAVVIDQQQWKSLYAKEPTTVRPIASITKLMTAMVVLDARLPVDDVIQIQRQDIDTFKRSSSRLNIGIRLTRAELLRLALMASENRAASALARTYPGGEKSFVAAMNRKAHELGMRDSRFVDPTGLNPGNVSSAFDVAVMVNTAYQYPAIREATTTRERRVSLLRGHRMRLLTFHNSNRLVAREEWDIGLSKTGYIREAGRCLVMQSVIGSKPVIIVLLDSMKKAARIADANYIRHWLSEETVNRIAPRVPEIAGSIQ